MHRIEFHPPACKRNANAGGLHAFEVLTQPLRVALFNALTAHTLVPMPISFSKITKGSNYSRKMLAELWGYTSFHAIARGVVTPRNDNKIILFVTEEKPSSAEQYADRLIDETLEWEGPTDHFAEERMLQAEANGEEIHLFHRMRHHSDFIYCGRLKVLTHASHTDRPSRFKFQVHACSN